MLESTVGHACCRLRCSYVLLLVLLPHAATCPHAPASCPQQNVPESDDTRSLPCPTLPTGSTAYALGIAFGMFACTEWKPEHITDLMPVGELNSGLIWRTRRAGGGMPLSCCASSSPHPPGCADYVTNGIILAAAAEPTEKVRCRPAEGGKNCCAAEQGAAAGVLIFSIQP